MYKQNLVCQTWCNNISFPLSTAVLQAHGVNTLQEKNPQKWINRRERHISLQEKKNPVENLEKQNILFCVGWVGEVIGLHCSKGSFNLKKRKAFQLQRQLSHGLAWWRIYRISVAKVLGLVTPKSWVLRKKTTVPFSLDVHEEYVSKG